MEMAKNKRQVIEKVKKMRSHLQELSCFFNQRMGALENMIEAFIEEELIRKRKEDK